MTNSVGSLPFFVLSLMIARISAARGTWNTSDGNYEYYASSPGVSKSYNVSSDECKKMDGELAMIKSAEIQDFLNLLLGLEGSRPYAFYIGLQESADGSYVWDDGDTLDYQHWQDHEPNSPGTETCVIAGNLYSKESDLKWRDVACVTTAKTGFICQRLIGKIWSEWGCWGECFCPGWQRRERNCSDTGRPGRDSCVGSGESATVNRTCWSPECNVTTNAVTTTPRPLGRGYWFPNGNFEYYVSPAGESVSYNESQENCQAKDGELALVKSAEVHSFIASLVSNDSGYPFGFYIGLKYDQEGDGFLWTDGSAVTYSNWHSGEPNRLINPGEDCVGMGYNYEYREALQWYDYDCEPGTTGEKGSVCQRRIGTYWSEWGDWKNCNCSMTQSRTRTCEDTLRPGPNTCNEILWIETRNCTSVEMCLAIETTEFPTSAVITTLPQATTEQKAFESSGASTSYNEIGNTTVIPSLQYALIGLGVAAGILGLIVISVIILRRLKRTSRNKTQELGENVTDDSPCGSVEYARIPIEKGLKEGEYATLKTDNEGQESEYCSLDHDRLKASYAASQHEKESIKAPSTTSRRNEQLESTEGYCSVDLVASQSIRNPGNNIVRTSMRQSPSSQAHPDTSEITTTTSEGLKEVSTAVKSASETETSSGEMYATVIKKSLRIRADVTETTSGDTERMREENNTATSGVISKFSSVDGNQYDEEIGNAKKTVESEYEVTDGFVSHIISNKAASNDVTYASLENQLDHQSTREVSTYDTLMNLK